MAKYIERDKLPQYSLYNSCAGDAGWSFIGDEIYAYSPITDGNTVVGDNRITLSRKEFDINADYKDFSRLIENRDNEKIVNEIYEKWINYKGKETQKFYELISILRAAIHKDVSKGMLWKDRLFNLYSEAKEKRNASSLLLLLAEIIEELLFAQVLSLAQGYPMTSNEGDIYYPKLLLIDSEYYKKKIDEKKSLNYDILRRGLQNNGYVIVINGDSGLKKMSFSVMDTDKILTVNMLDGTNGLSQFYIGSSNGLEIPENITALTCDVWHCHPRGDRDCNGNGVDNTCYYTNGVCNCRHKMLDIVATVVYCLQEYFEKVLNGSLTGKSESNTHVAGNITKKYVPDDMIRLYDIKLSDEELVRFNKFANYSEKNRNYTSTEKSPHVRRGYYRYNPRTGEKDIKVRGCIIHKEQYKGFSTVDRIKK